uniref:CCHC-type domain-containing protein n=1 Tax=Schistocephalus solidus TaxID=70667 RepID=A0A0X3P7E8_SCHSO
MDPPKPPTQTFRAGCKKCGFTGHMTFQCRNYLRADAAGDVVLDVESTSSESEVDEVLKAAIEAKRAELEAAAAKAAKKSSKKKKKHRGHSRHSRSRSRSSSRSRSRHHHRSEKHRKKHHKSRKT